MGKFAKLINLENDEQVLLTVDAGESEGEHALCIRTEPEGLTLSVTMGYDEEKNAVEHMENYEEKNAIAFRKDVIGTFS